MSTLLLSQEAPSQLLPTPNFHGHYSFSSWFELFLC